MSAADLPAGASASRDARPTLIPAPPELAEMAVVPDYAPLAAHAAREGDQFWAELGREIAWETNPTTAMAGTGAEARWFGDGMGNLVVNCLDRHLHESRRDKLALVWHGAHGETRHYTYSELHRLVCKFASGLKELGVGAGATIILQLPPSPEGIAALLACARLGAIVSPATQATGSEQLRTQIIATGARLLITTGNPDGTTALAEAQAGPDTPPRIIAWRRADDAMGPDLDTIDLADLLKGASPRCEPLIAESTHPFFTLPPDERQPTGGAEAQFAHGGYAVGVAYTTRIAYDLKDDTVFCPLAPDDWLATRPSLLLGPLLNGATIVLYEEPPTPAATWDALARDNVTTLVAPTTLLHDLAVAPDVTELREASALRLVISDGPPLTADEWWHLYRVILRERAHLCANWWEPAHGAPIIGTLPSMDVKPGWLGKPFPGTAVTVGGPNSEENTAPAAGELRLAGQWPHLTQGATPTPIAPEARRDEDGYITLVAPAAQTTAAQSS